MHVVEQNRETGRTALNGKYTCSLRTLRQRDVKDDERHASHDRKAHGEQGKKTVAAVETPVCQFSYACIINGCCGFTIKLFPHRQNWKSRAHGILDIQNSIQKEAKFMLLNQFILSSELFRKNKKTEFTCDMNVVLLFKDALADWKLDPHMGC